MMSLSQITARPAHADATIRQQTYTASGTRKSQESTHSFFPFYSFSWFVDSFSLFSFDNP
jgi:hypothetical protein